MKRSKMFRFVVVGVPVLVLSGCGAVHETDGSSRFGLLTWEKNMRSRDEVGIGSGGWRHNPDTISIHHDQPSAAVMKAYSKD